MRNTFTAIILISYAASCAKSRPKDKDTIPNLNDQGLDTPLGEPVSPTDLAPSVSAVLLPTDASGARFVEFSANEFARVNDCRYVGYKFKINGRDQWHSQRPEGGMNPYIVDGELEPGNPYDFGCDVMESLEIRTMKVPVHAQELVLISKEMLGEERLKLINDAAARGITASTEISVYSRKDVTAIRFDFEYSQGDSKFNFVKEFSLQ